MLRQRDEIENSTEEYASCCPSTDIIRAHVWHRDANRAPSIEITLFVHMYIHVLEEIFCEQRKGDKHEQK
jgi:hypothetical protein